MSLALVKQAIKVNLDALVTDEVLGGATITDIKKDPLAADMPSDRHAFLMPAAIKSEVVDNRTISRVCEFPIVIVYKAANLTSTEQLEGDLQAILDKFDNDPTLQGTSQGGILPVSSSPAPYQHNGRDLVVVEVTITGKYLVTLTY